MNNVSKDSFYIKILNNIYIYLENLVGLLFVNVNFIFYSITHDGNKFRQGTKHMRIIDLSDCGVVHSLYKGCLCIVFTVLSSIHCCHNTHQSIYSYHHFYICELPSFLHHNMEHISWLS